MSKSTIWDELDSQRNLGIALGDLDRAIARGKALEDLTIMLTKKVFDQAESNVALESKLYELEKKKTRYEFEFSTIYHEKDKLENQVAVMQEALVLIAMPKRGDGTYNRCREACEKLAATTLVKIEGRG